MVPGRGGPENSGASGTAKGRPARRDGERVPRLGPARWEATPERSRGPSQMRIVRPRALPASYHSRVASIQQKEVRRSFAQRLALKPLWPNAAPSWPKGREAGGGAMKRDSLSTLDLRERPENKITIIRRVHHHQIDGPLELRPGE